jgi:hypothetical protein
MCYLSAVLSFMPTSVPAGRAEPNRAVLFAYRGVSLGKNHQIDHNRPLLRQGMIAGKTEDERIVLDCPAYSGNSGGLVVEIVDEPGNHRNLGIGLISEQVPFVEELWSKQFKTQVAVRFENSGYSIAEPIDRVLVGSHEARRIAAKIAKLPELVRNPALCNLNPGSG